ncbi:MAG: hypothetical protein IKU84_06355 [Clostridia bacterium]|nr:hypothetical protein [Clostridia bacterium]
MNDYILYAALAVLAFLVLFILITFIAHAEEAAGIRKFLGKIFHAVTGIMGSDETGFVSTIVSKKDTSSVTDPNVWLVELSFNNVVSEGHFSRKTFNLPPLAEREIHYFIGNAPNSSLHISAIQSAALGGNIAYVRYDKNNDSFYLWAINPNIFTDYECTAKLENGNIKITNGLTVYLYGNIFIRFTAPPEETAGKTYSEVSNNE